MALPILYSFRRCPYAMRARLALQISGQPVELREVRLREKPPELLAASPKCTVPVLIDAEGTVIDESLDIMCWALSRNDPEDWLDASTASTAEMRALIARCDSEFKHSLDRYKYPQRFSDGDPLNARERAAQFLVSLDQRLASSPWLFGPRGVLADFAILPFVRQFAMVDPDWFESRPWPRLREWLAGFIASNLFAQVMRPLEPWSSNTCGVIFPVPPFE